MRGTVSNWHPQRGFGFIKGGDGQADIFCHIREVLTDADELPIGARVEFEHGAARDGRQCAKQVKVVGGP